MWRHFHETTCFGQRHGHSLFCLQNSTWINNGRFLAPPVSAASEEGHINFDKFSKKTWIIHFANLLPVCNDLQDFGFFLNVVVDEWTMFHVIAPPSSRGRWPWRQQRWCSLWSLPWPSLWAPRWFDWSEQVWHTVTVHLLTAFVSLLEATSGNERTAPPNDGMPDIYQKCYSGVSDVPVVQNLPLICSQSERGLSCPTQFSPSSTASAQVWSGTAVQFTKETRPGCGLWAGSENFLTREEVVRTTALRDSHCLVHGTSSTPRLAVLSHFSRSVRL